MPNQASEQEMTINVGPSPDGMVLFWTDMDKWQKRLLNAGATVERRGNNDGTGSMWARLPARQVKLVFLTKEQADNRSAAAKARATKYDFAGRMRARKADKLKPT